MQDSKNLILAIVLCILILIGWTWLARELGWAPPAADPQVMQQQQEMAEKAAAEEAQRQQDAAKAATLPVFTPSAGRDITVDAAYFKAVLHSGGGPLRSFELKQFHTELDKASPLVNMIDARTAAVAPLGLVVNGQASWSSGQWALAGNSGDLALAAGQKGTIALDGQVDNLRVSRELTFTGDSYLIDEKVRVVNPTDQPRTVRLIFTTASDASLATGGQYDAMRVGWDNNGSLSEESSADKLASQGVMENGKIYWAGAMSTYFLAAVIPGAPDGNTVKSRVINDTVFRATIEAPEMVLAPGEERTLSTSYWLGPKDRKKLLAVSDELGRSVDLGMFSLIAKGLLWLLEFFHSYVQNWGVAIILLTFVVKGLFWPLTAKSYSSMEKMKKLQPMMLAIREKHKDNKEALNKEVMALYKTYGVNPASGCVPILIQLPVFFGLYQALLTAIELRHASFVEFLPFTDKLWLADLSAKDPFYITPIIMGLTMFLQQRMSPPAQDATQQKIMMFLPIVFTFLFLGFPSGLVIYWLVNNVLSIFQQWLMMRKNAQKNAAAK